MANKLESAWVEHEIEKLPVRRLPGPTPATQMRIALSGYRHQGINFDLAWKLAWRKTRWPHDKDARHEWKDRLREDRDVWQAAYERTGSPTRSLRAVYSLLVHISDDRVAA